jgi:formate dehydrogenase iron-sulfur subunit
MPDKLSHLWWSPIIPILFFLSAVTSGIALVMLIDLLISYFYDRPYNWKMLSQMGKVLWGALTFYYAIRMADVIIRGKIGLAFSGQDGPLFLIEVIAGGIIPFVLLSQEKLRNNNKILVLGALLALVGVIFNRTNVVLLGMNLPGTMPGGLVEVYYPSLVEWTLSISLIAAAIFFYALGLKLLPILPKSGESH